MDITPQLSLWVQQLVAVAQTGIAFNPPVYDLERYEALLDYCRDDGCSDGRQPNG